MDINVAQFDVKSHLTDLLTMCTSSLPYLPHICEDFLLLESKTMFIFIKFLSHLSLESDLGWSGVEMQDFVR